MAYKIVIDNIITCKGKNIAYVRLVDDSTSEIIDTIDLEYTGDETIFTAAVKDRFKKRIDEIKELETAKTGAQTIVDKINILE